MTEEEKQLLETLNNWRKGLKGNEQMNGKQKLFALISNIISAILGAVGGFLGSN